MLDCQEILESELRCTVELVSPVGVEYTGLFGRVLFDSLETNQDGIPEIVRKPNVTIAINSLARVPQSSEKWVVRINLDNELTGDLTSYLLENAVVDGKSIGFVRLFLTKMEQS